MSLDFLGENEDNLVSEALVVGTGATIVLKRGFFFQDTVTLYGNDGIALDEDAYSFDLPIPDISGRIGRFIFGRIILNDGISATGVTYRTPYNEDDNRYNDIVKYTATMGDSRSTDYYNSYTGLFKSGVSTFDDAGAAEWFGEFDNLIEKWAERNIDYDTVLSEIDKFFTGGQLFGSGEVALEDLVSPSFFYSDGSNNSMTLSKWLSKWTAGTNLYSNDYAASYLDYANKISTLKVSLDNKYLGDVDADTASVNNKILNGVSEIRPIMSAGDETTELYLKDDELVFSNFSLPSHYSDIYNQLQYFIDIKDDVNNAHDDVKILMESISTALYRSIETKISGGYSEEEFDVLDNAVIKLNGEYLSNFYNTLSLANKLFSLNVTGTYATNTTVSDLYQIVNGLEISILDMNSIATNYSYLPDNISELLDSLCITKDNIDVSITDTTDISGVL